MATCTYCREDIPDNSTVCVRCGTFDPFSPLATPFEPEDYPEIPPDLEGFPSAPPDEVGVDQDSGGSGCWNFIKDLGCQYALGCGGIVLATVTDEVGVDQDSGGSGCWNFIKDLGCQYALGCGGIVLATVIGVIIVLIATVCGGEDGMVDCQDLHDEAMDSAMGWVDEDTGETLLDFRILEIASDVEKGSTEPGVEICRGVAQTTDGAESIYYIYENDSSFSIYTEPLDEPSPVTAPAPSR